MMLSLTIAILIVLSAIAFYVVPKGMVRIGTNEVGIVFKEFTFKLSHRPFPSHRLIALNGESGCQVDTLGAGLHWGYWPGIYTVRKIPLTRIHSNEIGLVVANDGSSLPTHRQLGRVVECDNFQDGRAFLINGGQKGRQLGILTTGTYQINTELFTIITVENATEHSLDPKDLQVYTVNPGKIGVVTALDGDSMLEGEIAGPCVQGHKNFQNGQVFIDGGGCRGVQEEVLAAGSYNLNPWFVKVEQVPLKDIPTGTVGVVVSRVGKTPQDHTSTDLVDPGCKGVWKTPLYPGQYPINPKITDVEIVPTHEITLDWSNKKDKVDSNYDAKLRALQIRSNDGFLFDIEVTQVISIRGEDAPKMILRVGSLAARELDFIASDNSSLMKFRSIRNLVTRVLEPMIGNHFRNSAQDYEALDFLKNRSQQQSEAVRHIKTELSAYGVQAIGTLINDIDLPDKLEEILQDRTLADEKLKTYQVQQRAEEENQKLEEARARTKMKQAQVEAEVGAMIARFEAMTQRLRNETEADAIQRRGEAQAQAIRLLVEILGYEGYLTRERLAQLSNIKLPDTIFGNNGWFDALIAQMIGVGINQQQPNQTDNMQLLDRLGTLFKEQPTELSMVLRSLSDHSNLSKLAEVESVPVPPLISTNDADATDVTLRDVATTITCTTCEHLNQESAHFCSQCGAAL